MTDQPAQPQKPQEREVSYEEAMRETGVDQAPAGESAQEKAQEDVLDVLKPKAEPKTWTIGKGELERQYVQRPLSFIGKMQWFSLIGEVLDKAMSGDDRLSINNLISGPSMRGGAITMADLQDADTFVQAVGKLLVYAPDFLTKSYCIWLGVPDYERDLAKRIMEQPPEQGGLNDDQGMEIIEIFIDQNYDALASFFRDKIGQLQQRVQARQKAAESQRSKR